MVLLNYELNLVECLLCSLTELSMWQILFETLLFLLQVEEVYAKKMKIFSPIFHLHESLYHFICILDMFCHHF